MKEGKEMNIYVFVHHDRHADDEIHVYSSKEVAIEEAKKRAREFDRFGELEEISLSRYFIYKGTYSCEGDHVRVEEKVLK
jgi:hypothetical protein